MASFSIPIANDAEEEDITVCFQFQLDGVAIGSPTTATIAPGASQTLTGTVGIQTCGQNIGMSMMSMAMSRCDCDCCDPCSSSVLTLNDCSPTDIGPLEFNGPAPGTLTVMRQPGRCGRSGCDCGGSSCDCG